MKRLRQAYVRQACVIQIPASMIASSHFAHLGSSSEENAKQRNDAWQIG
jgi:hypothetical protein